MKYTVKTKSGQDVTIRKIHSRRYSDGTTFSWFCADVNRFSIDLGDPYQNISKLPMLALLKYDCICAGIDIDMSLKEHRKLESVNNCFINYPIIPHTNVTHLN